MKAEVTDLGPVKKSLSVEADPDDVRLETEKAVRRWASQVRIPGFRQRKAPVDLVRRRFAREIDEEVRERVVARLYRQSEALGVPGKLEDPVLVRAVEAVMAACEKHGGIAASHTNGRCGRRPRSCRRSCRRSCARSRGRSRCAPAKATCNGCGRCTTCSACSTARPVKIEIDGVASKSETLGHRFHAPGAIRPKDFAEYAAKLRDAKVLIDREERKRIILLDGARKLCAAKKLELVEDMGLLEEVAGLAEWPVVLLGDMDPAFLDLPGEVIRLSMRTHQKYFAVRDPASGRLAPHFIVVANVEATTSRRARSSPSTTGRATTKAGCAAAATRPPATAGSKEKWCQVTFWCQVTLQKVHAKYPDTKK